MHLFESLGFQLCVTQQRLITIRHRVEAVSTQRTFNSFHTQIIFAFECPAHAYWALGMVQEKTNKNQQPIETDAVFEHSHILGTPGKSLSSYNESRNDLQEHF